MDKASISAAALRPSQARRPVAQRVTAISRARAARDQLRPRPERFAHLKRMHD